MENQTLRESCQGGSSWGSSSKARGEALCPQNVGFIFSAGAVGHAELRWRDGFSIDGGELRHYSDPGSREFMVCMKMNLGAAIIQCMKGMPCLFQASVMRGAIPAELVKEAKGGEVHVDMEDHRLE